MHRFLIASVFSAFCATAALAQTTTPAPEPSAETKPPGKPGTAAYECSKQADAQRLTGEERKQFRAKCREGFRQKELRRPTFLPSSGQRAIYVRTRTKDGLNATFTS